MESDSTYQKFIDGFSGGDLPEWHITKTFRSIRDGLADRLNEMLKRGAGFSIEADHFTPIEKDAQLTGDERRFLRENRKPVLCILQFDALWQSGAFEPPERLVEFEIDYNGKLTADLQTSHSHGSVQDRAQKALCSIVRRWFKDIKQNG